MLTSRLCRSVIVIAAALAWASGAMAENITIGVRNGPESMDPHASTLGSHVESMKHIYDPLVWAAEDLSLKPGLAESWKPVNATTWEFKIRRGVKFHDGTDLTAEDVKASIERIPMVGGTSPMTQMIRRIESAEIVDRFTIRLVTKGSAPALPNDLNRLFVIPKRFKNAKSDEFVAGRAAVGTGPFKLESWQPRSDLVLSRNDAYWRGKSDWTRVTRREIPNDAARVAALLTGQVDVISAVPASDLPRIKSDRKLKTFSGDAMYVFNLQLDQREKPPHVFDNSGRPVESNPFLDSKIREAMDLAIDRKTVAQIVMEGEGRPARSIVMQGLFGDPTNLPDKKFDLNRAKKLMAESKWPSGFKVNLHCTSDRFPSDAAMCQSVGQMLARIGIQAGVNAVSRTVYFPAHSRLEYSLALNGWGASTGEAGFAVDHLIHSPSAAQGLGLWNRNGYARPDLDTAIVKADAELDDDRRRAGYESILRNVIADRAWLPVVQLKTTWATRSTVAMVPRADEETLAYTMKPATN